MRQGFWRLRGPVYPAVFAVSSNHPSGSPLVSVFPSVCDRVYWDKSNRMLSKKVPSLFCMTWSKTGIWFPPSVPLLHESLAPLSSRNTGLMYWVVISTQEPNSLRFDLSGVQIFKLSQEMYVGTELRCERVWVKRKLKHSSENSHVHIPGLHQLHLSLPSPFKSPQSAAPPFKVWQCFFFHSISSSSSSFFSKWTLSCSCQRAPLSEFPFWVANENFIKGGVLKKPLPRERMKRSPVSTWSLCAADKIYTNSRGRKQEP